MTLTAIGVDRGTRITDGTDEVDELIGVPLERVVVVIDQNGIRPALMGHLEGLDDPVVACLSVTAEGCLIGGRGMTADSLIHHIDHGQVRIVFLHFVHPLHDGLILLLYR